MLLGASCYISGEEPGVRIVEIGSAGWSMLLTLYKYLQHYFTIIVSNDNFFSIFSILVSDITSL